MSAGGFYLTRLALGGHGLADAEVRFAEGLNVISGPSDTGKTFIFQCIDFMLGGSKLPKEIPEAVSYETLRLSLVGRREGKELTLERGIRGGDARLLAPGQKDRILGARHQAGNEDTVSDFLLELSGLANRLVRVNQLGKTRALSFRDLARLVMVDEETVISEVSPVFSGQAVRRTAEGSVFRLLLSGVDDTAVVAKDDPKISKVRREGRADAIRLLVRRTQEQIADLELDDEVVLGQRLERINSLFEEASAELAAEQESVAKLEERRHDAWAQLRQVESRAGVLRELQQRFHLLGEQYASDLRRLEAISEAGLRLGQMREERCPVCGALAEYHERAHEQAQARPETVAESCRAEAEKIRRLSSDLKETLTTNAAELERLGGDAIRRQAVLVAASGELRDRLRPRVQAALKRLQESQGERDTCRRALELHGRLHELEGLLREMEKPDGAEQERSVWARAGGEQVDHLSTEIEFLLRSWNFPDLGRVTFSDQDQDIVISGRPRASHGKGVRAITHAAFNIALLRDCWHRSMPHPGLVAIDSPLVVYREPDVEDGVFASDVKDAFFRSLASHVGDAQVIIIENEVPPEGLGAVANVIRFSGTQHGRSGFIPQRPRR